MNSRFVAGIEGGITALVAFFMAGCISAPIPANTHEVWTPPRDARKPDPVWTELRARSGDWSKPLSLPELADLALQNNPASRVAWNAARAAAAQVDQAQGLFMPTVTAVAGVDRQRTSASPSSFDQDYLRYGPALEVNYLILNFGGGRRAAVEQALQTVYATDFAYNRSLQDTLLGVETAYYSLVSALAGVEAAESSLKDALTALDAARERKASGAGTELDVLQAQAASDQARYNLANVQGLVKIARGGLAQAAGLPADTPVQAALPSEDVPDTLKPRDLRRLLDESLARRPDIASLRATVAAGEAAIKVAGAALWPSLYLRGGLGYEEYETWGGGRAFQDRDWSGNAGLSLRWTLFDGYQTTSARRAAVARFESARAQLQQAELAAGAEIWARYNTYETAIQKHTFSTAFLKSASASYDLALDSYKAGLKSILDLLTAESLVAQARGQQVAARLEVFTALARLAHAAGLLEKGGSAQIRDNFSTVRKDSQP